MTSFPTTHWSFITQLRNASGASRENMVASFLSRYLPPMEAYIRFRYPRLPDADRDDLMQDFVADRVIRRSVLDYARQNRGTLRVFLRTCLNNFARSWLVRLNRSQTVPSAAVDVDALHYQEDSGVCPFDRAWAHHIIVQGVERLRKECEGAQGSRVWAVFEARMYRPMLYGDPPTAYKVLSARLEVDHKALANLLPTAQRKLKNHLVEVIGDYTMNSIDAEEEIRDLFRVMGQERQQQVGPSDDA